MRCDRTKTPFDQAAPRSIHQVIATPVALVLAVGLLSGCAAIDTAQDQWRVDRIYKRTGDFDTTSKDPDKVIPLELEKLSLPAGATFCGTSTGSGNDAYGCALKNAQARDWVQDRILDLSIRVCEQHKGDITANAAVMNSVLGITTSALATLGAVVTGEGAKSALAGAAGFTGASQAILNQEIYQKFVGPAIVNSIEGDRANAMTEIQKKRKRAKAGGAAGETETMPITSYTADEAIRDAVDYHQRCSFYHGLSLLLASSKRVEVSDDEINTKITKLRDQITALRTLQTPLLVSGKAPTIAANPTEFAQYQQLSATISNLQAQIERESMALAMKPVR